MVKQILTADEINAMVRAMDEADFGPEIELELDEDYDEDYYDSGIDF